MFEISSMLRKKTPKSIKNHRKIDIWGSLGAILRPLGQHLGHIFPEDWILEAFGRVLVAQDVQLDSNSIESPQGGDTAGHPLREHLAHRCQDTEAQAFKSDVLWLGKISATFRLRMAQ